MNKKALIRTISQELVLPLSQDKITMVLDKAVEVAKRTLEVGEPVRWSGFGTLTVKEIPPKRLYSPVKKEYILTEGARKIIFVEPRRQKPNLESMSKLE